MKLAANALFKIIIGFLLLSLLLFLPAGTFAFYKAWLFIALLFIPMIILGIVLFVKNKPLLEKRLKTNETEKKQKIVILISSIQFILCFLICGFDFRYKWSHFPFWITALSSLLFLFSYGLYVEVLRENAYLSRTVEIQQNQRVIDTGLYGFVRHPMYFSTVLLFFSMPLVLGSWPAFAVMLPYPFIISKRILNEESILINGLSGYREYMQKVKYRLFPFIW